MLISDKMLKAALAVARDKELVELVELVELEKAEKPHAFSARFEKKMNKLIKSEKRVFYPFVNSFGKRFAVSLAAVLIISMTFTMSVSAAREGFFEMVQTIFEKFSIITYEPLGEQLSGPKSFVEYDLSKLPEGYVLAEESIDEFSKQKNSDYRNESNQRIFFSQYAIETADIMINTEGVTLEKLIVGEQEINYYSNLGVQTAFWDNGEYVFMLESDLDKEALINLIEYVQIVDL